MEVEEDLGLAAGIGLVVADKWLLGANYVRLRQITVSAHYRCPIMLKPNILDVMQQYAPK